VEDPATTTGNIYSEFGRVVLRYLSVQTNKPTDRQITIPRTPTGG